MPLPNHTVYDLLETADFLLQQRRGRADLLKTFRRRAISSAYYAVYQALCFVVADVIVGWGRSDDIVEPIFRTLDHKPVKDRLTRSNDAELRRLGAAFARLQDKRHEADYALPRYSPSHSETIELLQQARDAVSSIETFDDAMRSRLVVTLIAKPR